MALSDRLKYARERAGLTGPQVKQRAAIGISSLSDFENGKRQPSLSQLQALATAYRRSISFLLADGPIPEEAVLWRERPHDKPEQIEARFLRLCEQYHNLEVWADEASSIRLPTAKRESQPFAYADAEELAKDVRHELRLGDRPGLGLLLVLEEVCGVKVFHLDFEPTGTAACAMSETYGAGVLLNRSNARWRRNHDLAHELFHLLTWDVFRSSPQPTAAAWVPGEREERLATCFARNLLMPPEATGTAIRRRARGDVLPVEAVYDIARQFDVSVESLLWQVHFLQNRGRAGEQRTQREIQRAVALRPLMAERRETPPPVWPARYHALGVKALRLGEISIGRFAEYLDISRQEAMRYVECEVRDDDQTQVAPA